MTKRTFRSIAVLALAGALLLAPAALALPHGGATGWTPLWAQGWTWLIDNLAFGGRPATKAGPMGDPDGEPGGSGTSSPPPGEKAGPTADPDGQPGETAGPTADPNG